MRNCLSIIFFILQFSQVTGQTLTGKVTAQPGGGALAGAIVIADDTNVVTVDSSGQYIMNLSPGNHSLEFRMISFLSEKKIVSLDSNSTTVLNISLKEDVKELGIVVISAGKFEQRIEDVTVSMEVLKPKLVESRNTVNMEDAVEFIPGVNVIDGQANIRGGSGWSYGAGSRVQILIDDLPQLTADAADAKWNFMPVENLEQVEVIKGASSVMFGSSALNGVINIRTAYPRDTALTKITAFSGLYDKAHITTDKKYSLNYQDPYSYYSGVNFFHSRKINRLDLVVGGNYFDDKGYRQGEDEKRGRINFNTRYRLKTPGLSAGVNVNTMMADATIFFLWQNDTTGGYIPAAGTLSDSKTYRTNIDPYITYANNKGSLHKLRTRWFNSTNKNNTDQNSTADLYYAEYQYQKRFKQSITLTAGLVEVVSKVKGELYSDHTGNQIAGYVQGDIQWKRLTASAGTRLEQNKTDDLKDTITPVFRTGINFHLLKATYVRASAGQGYRFPSIAERYIKTTVGGVTIFPNEDLRPEKGVSYEIGLRQGFKLRRWFGYLDVAVFQNDYKNMMEFTFAQWEPTPGFSGFGFKSINVGDTRIQGVEVTLYAEGKLTDNVTIIIQGGYTYLDPRQLTYDSLYILKVGPDNYLGSDSTDFLKYRYRHMAKADIEINRKKISIGGSLRYTSYMENIDKIFTSGLLDLFFPPGLGIADYRNYHRNGDVIIDVRASYNIAKLLQLSAIVKNVTNHIYMQRPADMQPPRTFVLQASVKF